MYKCILFYRLLTATKACFYGLEMRDSAAHLISALIISGICLLFSIVWHGVYDSTQ